MRKPQISYDEMFDRLDRIDDVLAETKAEFERLLNETLDMYNANLCSKKTMSELMNMSKRKLEENEIAIEESKNIRKTIRKLKEN